MEKTLSINSNLFIIPIALLFNLFSYNTVYYVANYTATSKMCHKFDYGKPGYDECYKEREILLKVKDNSIFIASIIISVIGIIVGTILMNHPTLKTSGLGIGCGGILLLLFTVFNNWHRTTELMKLIYIGLGLIALIIASVKLL